MSVIFSPVKFTFPNIWFVPIPLFVGELYVLIINLRTICALRVLENERNQSINLQNQHLYVTWSWYLPQMVTQNMLRASIKEKRFFLIKNPICDCSRSKQLSKKVALQLLPSGILPYKLLRRISVDEVGGIIWKESCMGI